MAFPDMDTAIQHYNEIPYCCIKDVKSILDIGSSNGIMAKSSNYSHIFDKVNDAGNYLGVDIQEFEVTHYHVIRKDVLDFIPEREYDLVIASHIIEHIDIGKWGNLLDRLYGCVAQGGYIIINVPFKQNRPDYGRGCAAMEHKVIQIDKWLLEGFLPNGRYFYSRERRYHFREKGEFFLYAVLRFIYRALTFHPFSIFIQRGYPCRIIGVWRKKEV